MPFTSPFGMITTPSFNPSYSNVPQNKPLKPAPPPQNKPLGGAETPPESQESSVSELNAGVTPHIFAPQAAVVPEAPQFNPQMMQPQLPPQLMYAPQPFNQQYMAAAQQRAMMPQLPQRLNPNRLIFV